MGSNNLLGPNTVIVDHDHECKEKNTLICKQGLKSNPIKIGSEVWIGGYLTVCAGASIVDHIIIAANSVVKGRLYESGVYAGCPARLVKMR